MELADEILQNWDMDIPGYAHEIPSLADTSFPAWTVNDGTVYGVILLYDGSETINESFANVRIISKENDFEGRPEKQMLTLTSDSPAIKESFAALCAALVAPGENGRNRKSILGSPIAWWMDWKEMLGNKNIDPRIYDVLGELCVFRKLLTECGDVAWNGPKGASYDFETESSFVEVKSTISRDKREVSVSNHFQLKPEGKPLNLVLCQFEPSNMTGVSVDGIVNNIASLGYNTAPVEEALRGMGFEPGMSARKKTFILHDMLQYAVDDNFPRITPESFVDGVLPAGITKITYTVDLSGMPAVSLLHGAGGEL